MTHAEVERLETDARAAGLDVEGTDRGFLVWLPKSYGLVYVSERNAQLFVGRERIGYSDARALLGLMPIGAQFRKAEP